VTGREPLVIDDVAPCLARMTELGRAVAAKPIESVRAAVHDHAARRGWTVVAHCAFAAWARDLVATDRRPWIVLDPLLEPDGLSEWMHPLRLTRRSHTSGGSVVLGAEFAWRHDGHARDAGVIDDGAASGRTLLAAAHMIRQAGGTVVRAAHCASSRMSREAVWRAIGHIGWYDYVTGDWMIMHLRDGSPYLPYSGRLTGQTPVVGPNGPVQIRLPATTLPSNLWSVAWMDPGVRSAILAARRDIARAFSAHLGHPARISDLPLLGPAVPALVDSDDATPDADTTLASLMTTV
jgi:hypothetical protein